MYFYTKTFFISWILSIHTTGKINVSAGTSKGNQNQGLNGEQLKSGMTMTNMKEVTNIPIGYQNPHETNSDMKAKNASIDEVTARSQRVGKRWQTEVPIFYLRAMNPKKRCLLQLGIDKVNLYSCIPLKLHVLEEDCSTGAIEDCLTKEGWSKEKIEETFKGKIKDHVIVTRNRRDGCSSDVGRIGGRQTINLHDGCFGNGFGTVMHEVLHALGYNHEHTRLDRDEYVTIVEENLDASNAKYNFMKSSPIHFKDFGPYDFYSLMHYSAFAFSKDARKLKTIIVKNVTEDINYSRIGQRVDLTEIDKAKIRAVTQCPENSYEENAAAVNDIDKNVEFDQKARKAECDK